MSSAVESTNEKAIAAKNKGNEAFKNKNFAAAIRYFSEAIDNDSTDAAFFSNRSAAYVSVGKNGGADSLDRALADADKAVELRPDWGKGYARRAVALVAMERFEDAVKQYALGLSKDPSDATLLTGLAAAQKRAADAKAGKAGGSGHVDKEKGKQNYVIGIDLGTTFSCVGVWIGDGVVIIENDEGERTTPSFVSFTDDGRFVGQAAKSMAARNPNNTVYDIKRVIGRGMDDDGVKKDIERFPFSVVRGAGDKPMVELPVARNQTRLFAPEEISAMVLAKLKAVAEKHLGQAVKDAVITVPAYFNDSQRAATKAAGAIAGLNVLRIINEPTAAALAYGLDNVTKGQRVNILIFDLGGGTFDVSILRLDDGLFEVLATGGDTHLGGEDFDHNIAEFLAAQAEEKHGFTHVKDSEKKMRRLRTAAERAKRQLSQTHEVEVRVESLDGERDFVTQFTRAQFEQVNSALFERCIDTVKHVLKDAKLKQEDLDECVLVGGSTRIPKIQAMLQGFLGGRELCKNLNPDEAVAYGAAVQGAILSGNRNKATENLLLRDVTPLSLGIETVGRVMSVIIPRNTPIPCVRTQTYTTEENYQTAVDVCVYEGERLRTEDNNLLGKFTITGIEKAKRGEPKVDVSFALDSNGILNVTAKDQKTGAEARIEIASKGRASGEDVERMIKEAEAFRRQDEQRVKKLEARNQMEAVIAEVLEVASTAEKKIAPILEKAAQAAQIWLDDNGDTATAGEINAQSRALEIRIQSRKTQE